MGSEPTMLLQGTLDLLILNSLLAGEMHGLGISRRIQQITRGTFVVKPGSLFPALHRMEQEGWISAFWGDSEPAGLSALHLFRFWRPLLAGTHGDQPSVVSE